MRPPQLSASATVQGRFRFKALTQFFNCSSWSSLVLAEVSTQAFETVCFSS